MVLGPQLFSDELLVKKMKIPLNPPLPKSVKISGFDIELIMIGTAEADERAIYGLFSSKESNIRIYHNGNKWKTLDTVIHELLHAVFWAYNIHDDDKEERTVSTVSVGLTQVFRDNPELVKWVSLVATS